MDAPVSASQVWRVWSDLANWHTWDSGVDWVRPDGPFAEGTTYTMKPSAGPEGAGNDDPVLADKPLERSKGTGCAKSPLSALTASGL